MTTSISNSTHKCLVAIAERHKTLEGFKNDLDGLASVVWNSIQTARKIEAEKNALTGDSSDPAFTIGNSFPASPLSAAGFPTSNMDVRVPFRKEV